MSWRVEYTKAALKQLKKMDRFDARLILSWIGKNLEGCDDPRIHGKGLTANRGGEWRYRVGDYRILCIIEDDKLVVNRARKIQRFLSQPFSVATQFTGLEGKYVPITETVRGFKEILEGKHDDIPESYFLNAGTIDEVREKYNNAQ
mgnify:CR=1 FL=1